MSRNIIKKPGQFKYLISSNPASQGIKTFKFQITTTPSPGSTKKELFRHRESDIVILAKFDKDVAYMSVILLAKVLPGEAAGYQGYIVEVSISHKVP